MFFRLKSPFSNKGNAHIKPIYTPFKSYTPFKYYTPFKKYLKNSAIGSNRPLFNGHQYLVNKNGRIMVRQVI